jgi:hypothetical protein
MNFLPHTVSGMDVAITKERFLEWLDSSWYSYLDPIEVEAGCSAYSYELVSMERKVKFWEKLERSTREHAASLDDQTIVICDRNVQIVVEQRECSNADTELIRRVVQDGQLQFNRCFWIHLTERLTNTQWDQVWDNVFYEVRLGIVFALIMLEKAKDMQEKDRTNLIT